MDANGTLMGEEKPFAAEGYQLMGAAFEVHRVQGGGLLEEIYQESLEVELESRGIGFAARSPLQTFYKDGQLKKQYIPDLLVFGSVVVEIKAVSAVAPEHEAQLLNDMRISRRAVGDLLDFGPVPKLEWKRFILSEFLKN